MSKTLTQKTDYLDMNKILGNQNILHMVVVKRGLGKSQALQNKQKTKQNESRNLKCQKKLKMK